MRGAATGAAISLVHLSLRAGPPHARKQPYKEKARKKLYKKRGYADLVDAILSKELSEEKEEIENFKETWPLGVSNYLDKSSLELLEEVRLQLQEFGYTKEEEHKQLLESDQFYGTYRSILKPVLEDKYNPSFSKSEEVQKILHYNLPMQDMFRKDGVTELPDYLGNLVTEFCNENDASINAIFAQTCDQVARDELKLIDENYDKYAKAREESKSKVGGDHQRFESFSSIEEFQKDFRKKLFLNIIDSELQKNLIRKVLEEKKKQSNRTRAKSWNKVSKQIA